MTMDTELSVLFIYLFAQFRVYQDLCLLLFVIVMDVLTEGVRLVPKWIGCALFYGLSWLRR